MHNTALSLDLKFYSTININLYRYKHISQETIMDVTKKFEKMMTSINDKTLITLQELLKELQSKKTIKWIKK
jgi:hypothetical protein